MSMLHNTNPVSLISFVGERDKSWVGEGGVVLSIWAVHFEEEKISFSFVSCMRMWVN